MKHTMIDTSQMELSDKVVAIKRVTKVVKGGRNMRFTALVVVVGIFKAKWLAEFGAELEDVADFGGGVFGEVGFFDAKFF